MGGLPEPRAAKLCAASVLAINCHTYDHFQASADIHDAGVDLEDKNDAIDLGIRDKWLMPVDPSCVSFARR
jgi:hypothetical protein